MPVPEEVREAMARAMFEAKVAYTSSSPDSPRISWDDFPCNALDPRKYWFEIADAALSALQAVGYAQISVSLFGEVVAALRGATLQDRTRREDDILRRADAALLTASNPKEQAP